MALFSVVIPLYNKENHIQKTLNCVLSQSFTNFEIIIINDGSTDNSLKKAEDIKDSRIFLYSIKNQGVSNARNYGIKKANSDYICFLDADDFWYNNHLSVSLKFNTKKLPINDGMAKFNIHINAVTVATVNSFKPINPKSQIAIEPFITQSRTAKLGIRDAKMYMQNIKLLKKIFQKFSKDFNAMPMRRVTKLLL